MYTFIFEFLSLRKLVLCIILLCREKWTDLLRDGVILTPEVIVETVAKLERYYKVAHVQCILVIQYFF